ncbi:MAG: hypothetical protein NWE94_01450 [Candidatus Bathyarchaeota archaeon]|nr:hypothetical protein [Candidatus Bathyarchaeota archaeon]
MVNRKLKLLSVTLNAIAILLILLAVSTSLNPARGATISMANYYPEDGETYGFIDHFIDQTTAVNTNTTVTVSIDGKPPITMTYMGIINEKVPGDTVARDWYTWQATVPPITETGTHTFQFFRHYYVWQEADQYWAEFNSYSTVQSFNISNPTETASDTPQPTATANPSNLDITIVALMATAALLILTSLALQKRTRQQNQIKF